MCVEKCVLANSLRIFHGSPQNNKLQVCNFYDNSKPTNARFVHCNNIVFNI